MQDILGALEDACMHLREKIDNSEKDKKERYGLHTALAVSYLGGRGRRVLWKGVVGWL